MRPKKKVALVFSGQSRFALHGATQTLHYLSSVKDSSLDIFFHTWEQESNLKFPRWIDPDKIIFDSPFSLVEQLKPVKYLIEKQDVLPEVDLSDVILTEANPKSILSMFYSMSEADKLRQLHEKECGFTYDVVMRSRFDYFPVGAITLTGVQNNVCIFPDLLRNKSAFCDWFFWGSSEAMAKAQNTISNFPKLIEMKIPFCGEDLLRAHLILQKIEPIKHKASGFLIRDLSHNDLTFGKILAQDSIPLYLKYTFNNILFKFKNRFITS